jgi:hypothetical protein
VAVLGNRSDYDCSACSWGRHCDSSNPAPWNKWKIPGVIESNVCLLPMITEKSLFLIRLHRHYKNGILFDNGGIMKQPNVYLEAMDLLDTFTNE